jgi:hypothetical protein
MNEKLITFDQPKLLDMNGNEVSGTKEVPGPKVKPQTMQEFQKERKEQVKALKEVTEYLELEARRLSALYHIELFNQKLQTDFPMPKEGPSLEYADQNVTSDSVV